MTTSPPVAPQLNDHVGGYRLLRKIGEGTNAAVFVGFADDESRAAVKVYRLTAQPGCAEREMEALWRAEHDHVVRLLDVSHRALILERLEWGALDDLLLSRGPLNLGEVVNVLAPISATIDFMHHRGVAHGAISTRSILFRTSGIPVLACFGASSLFTPDLTVDALARVEEVRRDRMALLSLAVSLLAATGEPRAEALISWCLSHRAEAADPVGLELAERLFRLDHPVAVSFVANSSVEGEALTVTSSISAVARRRSTRNVASRPPRPQSSAKAVGPRRSLVEGLAALVGTVRRPVWVILGISIAALVSAVIATSLLSSESSAAGTKAVNPAHGAPSPKLEKTQSPASNSANDSDPITAARSLLHSRSQCFAERSIDCLREVEQAGSSAFLLDSAAMKGMRSGRDTGGLEKLDSGRVRLAEEVGDSAIVFVGDKSNPASVLLVKGEAGWLIRSIFTS